MKRSTLLAGAVLVLLGGYIYLYEREPAVEEEGKPVFEAEREAVVRIELEVRDEEPVALEKRGGLWRLVAPFETEADEDEVALLLDNLESMRFERSVAKAAEVDLADFGLEPPVVSVAFRADGGESWQLLFGSDTPTSGNRYAMRAGGEDILVLESYLSLNFEKTAWDLRDKRIFDADEKEEVERVAIARDESESEIVLVLGPEGYRLEAPFRARADRFQTDALIREIRDAEMQALTEGADTAFEPSTASVRLDLSDGSSLVLEVGAKKDFDYFGRSPSREEHFLVEGGLADDLTSPATAYVAKELFSLRAEEVGALLVDGHRFERSPDGESPRWRRSPAAEDDETLDSERVETLVERLTSASADEVSAPGPRFEAASRLTLVSKGDAPREELVEIGVPREGLVTARRAGEDALLRFSEASWEELQALLALIPASGTAP